MSFTYSGPDGETAIGNDSFKVRKIGHVMRISDELAMEYGIIPDTRPAPKPPTRRERFRWWRQDKAQGFRERLASRVVGYDVAERDY